MSCLSNEVEIFITVNRQKMAVHTAGLQSVADAFHSL